MSNTRWLRPAAITWGLAVSAGLLLDGQVPVQSPPSVTEDLIAEKDPTAPANDKEDTVSRDGRNVAWRTERNKKWSVMLNGERQGGAFEEVRSLTFSRDSQHLAFAARSGKTWVMVVDAKEPAQRFDEVGGPVFSRDGRRLSYAAKRDKKWVLAVDGELSPVYDDVGLLGFSQDGLHVGLTAKRAGKWVVIVDGQERSSQFDELADFMFSPDGQRLAYAGRRGSKWMVVTDGKEGPPFDLAVGLTFSSDSRRFGYVGANIHLSLMRGNEGRSRVFIDGEPSQEFEGRGIGQRANLAGTASEYFGYLVYRFLGATPPVFGPDGSRVAYAARRGKDDEVVMVDGKAGTQVASIIGGPVFSGDGRHVAYAVSDADVRRLVVDGEPVGSGCPAGTDVVHEITFAPDNDRVSFVGVIGGRFFESGMTRRARRRVYVDGKGETEYDAWSFSGPWFSPDSHHISYVVHHLEEASQDVSFVVTDGIEGKRYDRAFAGTLEVSDTAVTYTAQAERKFVRVTQPLQ